MLTNSAQLDKYTTPCLNKATLLLNSNLNTELMDARCDPSQQSLKNKTTKLESNNLINSDHVLSPTQENYAANRTTAQASENNDITQESELTLDEASALSDSEGHVTAVVAKVKYEAKKVEPTGKLNILAGIAPVTTSSRYY